MRRFLWFLLAGITIAQSAVAAPQPPVAKAAPERVKVKISGETVNLPNGMTFLLIPRTGAPTFAGYIGFKVGGVDSVTGDTGLAHMFEHMAFKGTHHLGTTDWEKEKPILDEIQRLGDSLTLLKAQGKGTPEEVSRMEAELKRLSEEEHKYIVKDEFDRLYSQVGGKELNANTSVDLTQYFVQLPSNAMELWMMIESQRMREPVMREFYSERDVISQERLMRYDNSPIGRLYENFIATAFMASPYRQPTIGWASDIQALTMRQAQEFFHKNYSPSNAVGILVGNFDTAATKSMIERYFGSIQRRGDPDPIVTREPVQLAERRVSVPFEANPMMLIGYHKPCWPNRDDIVMDVIQTILSDGVTSRLYRRLVEKEQLVLDVQSSNGDPGTRYDNLYIFFAMPNEGVQATRVEEAIYSELDRLKKEPVPQAELEKAKTRIASGFLRRLKSDLGTALMLSSYQFLGGDWKKFEGYLDDMQSVSSDDVMAAASKYFNASNRTVATLVKPDAGPVPAGTGKEVQK